MRLHKDCHRRTAEKSEHALSSELTNGADRDPPSWKLVQRARNYELVLAQVEEQIVLGRLRPGDRLPAERELSKELGVSRSSVREALRALEALGILSVRPGTGPEAGTLLAPDAGDGLSKLLRLHVALHHYSLDETVEARVALEAWNAAQASRRQSPAQLACLDELVEAMVVSDLTPKAFSELDTTFHIAIAKASGNQLMEALMEGIREAIRHWMARTYSDLDAAGRYDETRATLVAQHRRIVALIRSGDTAAAAEAATNHIRDFYKQFRYSIAP